LSKRAIECMCVCSTMLFLSVIVWRVCEHKYYTRTTITTTSIAQLQVQKTCNTSTLLLTWLK